VSLLKSTQKEIYKKGVKEYGARIVLLVTGRCRKHNLQGMMICNSFNWKP